MNRSERGYYGQRCRGERVCMAEAMGPAATKLHKQREKQEDPRAGELEHVNLRLLLGPRTQAIGSLERRGLRSVLV